MVSQQDPNKLAVRQKLFYVRGVASGVALCRLKDMDDMSAADAIKRILIRINSITGMATVVEMDQAIERLVDAK